MHLKSKHILNGVPIMDPVYIKRLANIEPTFGNENLDHFIRFSIKLFLKCSHINLQYVTVFFLFGEGGEGHLDSFKRYPKTRKL